MILQIPPAACSSSIDSNSDLKFPLPKPSLPALDDLEEERRAILDRLGENLQQVSFFVAVDEDVQLPDLVGVFRDCAMRSPTTS